MQKVAFYLYRMLSQKRITAHYAAGTTGVYS
jgi:hypothetical protein